MKNMYLVLAFLIGCVTAKFVPVEIPKAQAGKVKKWEYWCVDTRDAVGESYINFGRDSDEKKWNQFLNKSGTQGWELVEHIPRGADNAVYAACFKRQKT